MSDRVTFYQKVRAVGHREIQELLENDVVIQEKVDGSNFSFGRDADGVLFCLSRSQKLNLHNPEMMFKAAVDYVVSISHHIPVGEIYRCEYLRTPRHNVLAYHRIPKHHLVLFDIESLSGLHDFRHFHHCDDRRYLERQAEKLEIAVIPELFRGSISSLSHLSELADSLLRKESFLGGPLEGIVVKNFSRFNVHGVPLVGKIVRKEFKETHQHLKNSEKLDPVSDIGTRIGGPARWQKAVQRLTEEGRLAGALDDIPALMKRVRQDVEEECVDEVKEALWQHFRKSVLSGSCRGLGEWYKDQLARLF